MDRSGGDERQVISLMAAKKMVASRGRLAGRAALAAIRDAPHSPPSATLSQPTCPSELRPDQVDRGE
jgi:hypothetical protein